MTLDIHKLQRSKNTLIQSLQMITELDGRTVFSETLGYDSPSNSLGGPSYAGLITRKGETWTIPTGQSPSQFQSVSRTEDYVYDHAARLSAGFYSVDDYAPYGTKSTSSASSYLNMASTGTTVSLRDGFTGKEEQGPDFGVGYIDFGARQYSPTLSRWLVPDPMGEKYYDISPYAYCAGNPVNLVDPTGEFLYIGDYLFFQGRLFDQTGELIDIKELDEFTLDAFNALAEINTTAVGRELVDELQYSDFTFIIRPAEFSQFKRDNTQGSVGNLIQQSREDQVVGSGGTIFWNSEGSPLFTQKGLLINATTDLAHEMFHGMDANHGVLDNRLYKRIKKDEWQAVYNENRLRKELGLPLRTYYMKGIDSEGVLHPVGARMIRWGKPKELNWYK
jgi:RHS repeat-associated protein